jgi:hypothetical protein
MAITYRLLRCRKDVWLNLMTDNKIPEVLKNGIKDRFNQAC